MGDFSSPLGRFGSLRLRLSSARPLDPYNPARLPGRWSRATWSWLASTALIIAPAFEGFAALFLASLGVGTILAPGLNDSYHPRRDENASWLGRLTTNFWYRFVGGLILKVVGVVVAWVSQLLWPPLWLPLLTALAAYSIKARTGKLLDRGANRTEVDADLREVFEDDLPLTLSSLKPDNVSLIRSTSDKKIREHFSRPLADHLIRWKKRQDVLDWYRRKVVLPRMLATLGALAVWMGFASALILSSDRIAINASNYNGAYGSLIGILAIPLFQGLRR